MRGERRWPRSICLPAPGDDVARRVLGGVEDGIGDDPGLVGRGEPRGLDAHLGERLVEERGVDHRGHHVGHAYGPPVAPQLHAQRLEEAVHAVLGGAVGALERHGAPGEDRGDVHERAAPLALYGGQRRHRAVGLPRQVHVHDALELLRLQLLEPREDRGRRQMHPGAEPTVLFDGPLSHGLHLPEVRHLRRHRRRFASFVPDLFDQGAQVPLVAGRDDHLRAAPREPRRRFPANAARRAHQRDDLVLDLLELHPLSFRLSKNRVRSSVRRVLVEEPAEDRPELPEPLDVGEVPQLRIRASSPRQSRPTASRARAAGKTLLSRAPHETMLGIWRRGSSPSGTLRCPDGPKFACRVASVVSIRPGDRAARYCSWYLAPGAHKGFAKRGGPREMARCAAPIETGPTERSASHPGRGGRHKRGVDLSPEPHSVRERGDEHRGAVRRGAVGRPVPTKPGRSGA